MEHPRHHPPVKLKGLSFGFKAFVLAYVVTFDRVLMLDADNCPLRYDPGFCLHGIKAFLLAYMVCFDRVLVLDAAHLGFGTCRFLHASWLEGTCPSIRSYL